MNGFAITFLVDTGTAVTLMCIDVKNKLDTEKQAVGLEPWAERKLVGVDGTSLYIHVHAVVDLTINGTVYQLVL